MRPHSNSTPNPQNGYMYPPPQYGMFGAQNYGHPQQRMSMNPPGII